MSGTNRVRLATNITILTNCGDKHYDKPTEHGNTVANSENRILVDSLEIC